MYKSPLRRGLCGLALSVLLFLASAQAATFVVDSPDDSHDVFPGDGLAADHAYADSAHTTLRAAVEEVNALRGADTILVPYGVTPIHLSLGTLTLLDNHTVVSGVDGSAVLDAVYNPVNLPTLSIVSDSNTISGLTVRRSRGDAIVIAGAFNQIGGKSTADRMIFADNGIDNPNAAALLMLGTNAHNNFVLGCYIGMLSNGMTMAPNHNGIVIDGLAHSNRIGDPDGVNIISGNSGYGVIMSNGSSDNVLQNSFIGPDSTGNSGPGNASGGVLVTTGSHTNTIGGAGLSHGNLISGNSGHGIELSGQSVTACTINGNLIGSNITGDYFLPNDDDGIRLSDGSASNTIGGDTDSSGNLISGNGGSGIHLVGPGVDDNVISSNQIGNTLDGYSWLGNGWIEGDGILLDNGPSDNLIGGRSEAERNVVSANYGFGIKLTGAATSNNEILGNYIGVNIGGSSSLGNVVGVGILDGAHDNAVGGDSYDLGNVISGNYSGDFPYGCGVLIFGAGSEYNRVSANLIGLDAGGVRARRNGSAGVNIGGGAKHNRIGGQVGVTGNVISGNGYNDPIEGTAGGVHIFGTGTSYNSVEGNIIGLNEAGTTFLYNAGHGVGIYAGASHNRVGGEDVTQGNIIGGNRGAGVFVDGAETSGNLIRMNSIHGNDGLGIDLEHDAQNGISAPQLTLISLFIELHQLVVDGVTVPGATVDVYQTLTSDPTGAGEAGEYVGTTVAGEDGVFQLVQSVETIGPIAVTTTATDSESNTSEFSLNITVGGVTDVDADDGTLPLRFQLYQNYPNPFNPTTRIRFDLPRSTEARLRIVNLLGRTVRTLIENRLPAGRHAAEWDGFDDDGRPVASGIYFYYLVTDETTAHRKMVLLK